MTFGVLANDLVFILCHWSSYSSCAHSSWFSGVAHLGSILFGGLGAGAGSFEDFIQVTTCEFKAVHRINCEQRNMQTCRMKKRPAASTDHVSNSVFTLTDCPSFHSDPPSLPFFDASIEAMPLSTTNRFLMTWTLTKCSVLSFFDLDRPSLSW